MLPPANQESKFLGPYWGDIVDSGIGYSYRPARLHRLAGRYDHPKPESTISPQSGTKNLASGFYVINAHLLLGSIPDGRHDGDAHAHDREGPLGC
jgi:hypothetical protein